MSSGWSLCRPLFMMLSKESSIGVWSLHRLEAADLVPGWGLHSLGGHT